jgi:hypothetical protein
VVVNVPVTEGNKVFKTKTIVKSSILPVLNYYLSILTPHEEWLKNISAMVENFLTNGLNISKEKIYLEPERGGIGMFVLDDFFKALKCTWVKRCMTLMHDNWRYILFNKCSLGPLYMQHEDAENCGPLLKGIIDAFVSFRNQFGCLDSNFLRVPILNNPNFNYDRTDVKSFFDSNYFELNLPGINDNILRQLTWSDISSHGNLKTIDQLTALLNVQVPVPVHDNFRKGLKIAIKNSSKNESKITHFSGFMSLKVKGSKNFRIVLAKAGSIKQRSKCPLVNYCHIAEIEKISTKPSMFINSFWCRPYHSSEIRTFIFKLHHNTLGLNNRVAHINPDRDPSCTFCKLTKNFPCVKESFTHLFWYCPTTTYLFEKFANEFFGAVPVKKLFFTGTDENGNFSEAVFEICSLFKYVLWQFKLRKRIPTWPSFKSDLNYLLQMSCKSSKKLEIAITNNILFRNDGEPG